MPGHLAEFGRERSRREAFPLAKGQEHRLAPRRPGPEALLAPRPTRIQFQRARPGFQGAWVRAAQAVGMAAGSRIEGVCAHSETEHRLALPIARIVAGAAPGTRIARDLVPQVARCLEPGFDVLDHVGCPVFVAALHAARCERFTEGCLGLESQLVGRDVFGPERDQRSEIAIEIRERLVREREDQVEREIVEIGGARSAENLVRDGRAMGSAKALQLLVLEGLDPDREAIDARRAKAR